jgi:hypothetical protein
MITANVGDLVGNWSWTVWLLIPVALGLALITALALGPLGEPTAEQRRVGGVTRHLARRGTTTDTSKEAS